jgi:Fe-S-cluster containining protein
MPVSTKFIRTCKKCKALCCTLVIPPVTEQERKKILKAGFEDHFKDIGNGIYEIKRENSNACPYLSKDWTCKIQSFKPELCKLWPIIPRIKNDKRSLIVVKCPIYPYLSEEEIIHAKKDSETISDIIIEHIWNISEEMKDKYKQFEYEKI